MLASAARTARGATDLVSRPASCSLGRLRGMQRAFLVTSRKSCGLAAKSCQAKSASGPGVLRARGDPSRSMSRLAGRSLFRGARPPSRRRPARPRRAAGRTGASRLVRRAPGAQARAGSTSSRASTFVVGLDLEKLSVNGGRTETVKARRLRRAVARRRGGRRRSSVRSTALLVAATASR